MPVFGGGTREIDVILWEMAQTRHLAQSAELAKAVEAQLRALVPMSPRPLQQAPFRVLVGANMPAVLVELGYLTNGEQESALASAPFQTRLARAHHRGRVALPGADGACCRRSRRGAASDARRASGRRPRRRGGHGGRCMGALRGAPTMDAPGIAA